MRPGERKLARHDWPHDQVRIGTRAVEEGTCPD